MAKDVYHHQVRTALVKDGWQITNDPLRIKIGSIDLLVDLGAELLAAELNNRKIAVEIKSFLGASEISEFHTALGQYLNYRDALAEAEPERQLYLAIPLTTYRQFFRTDFIGASVARYQLKLIIYDPQKEVIVQWSE